MINHFKIDRESYKEKLKGFWLGQCIANWTGLITEMDKIGTADGKGAGFYDRTAWGGPDQPNIWGSNDLSDTIGFYLIDSLGVWGADDDTDLEYMYLFTMFSLGKPWLNGEDIRQAWIRHIHPEEENFLWVSNQKAFDLMQKGIIPPGTGSKENNPYSEMIDAQLTTEMFGLMAPGRPDIALDLAQLPIQTVARNEAQAIAEFYVVMHAQAGKLDRNLVPEDWTIQLADEARKYLSDSTYPALMYDYVKRLYQDNYPWEATRDSLHRRFNIEQEGDYHWFYEDEVCSGCFAAGINFGAGMISWFYGEGDLKETIKIGALAGWDSDNPTATWGGLLGFIYGYENIREVFGQNLSDKFNIHRTRKGFPDGGVTTFDDMAEMGLSVIDSLVLKIGGTIDTAEDCWLMPET